MAPHFKFPVFAVLLIVSTLSLLAYFAEGQHYIELLSHFRVQYLSIQLICLGFLLFVRDKRLAVLAVACTVINIMPLLPYYTHKPRPVENLDRFKVMQVNVYGPNQDHRRVLELIHSEGPDIVGFEEVRPHWAEILQSQLKEYPYRIVEAEKTAFGIALFSKRPLSNAKIERYGKPYGPSKRMFPSIVANITLEKQPVSLMVTHPLPPMRGFEVRNSQLESIAQKREQLHQNFLLLGDLNVTPWSPYFQRLIRKANLKDSSLGFGVQSSWKSPLPGVLIPIDHVLISNKFIVTQRKLGPDIGSDHLPVIVEVALIP